MNKKNLEERLKEISSKIASERQDINAIILHGSQARGDSDENADYDLAIFFDNDSRYEIIKDTRNIEHYFLKHASISIPEIHSISNKNFKQQFEKSHSFLYCIFRDGKVLYQKDNWFDKTKPKILELKPKKETARHYLESALNIFNIFDFLDKNLDSLYFEDAKRAVNMLGFGIIMFYGKYPISPHTLKQELEQIKLSEIAESIHYIQKKYYDNKTGRITKKYLDKINFLKGFTELFLEKNFK